MSKCLYKFGGVCDKIECQEFESFLHRLISKYHGRRLSDDSVEIDTILILSTPTFAEILLRAASYRI